MAIRAEHKKKDLSRKKARITELFRAGRWRDTLAVCKKPDKSAAKDKDIMLMLGVAHGQLGQLSESTACFRQIVKLSPDSPQAFFNLGLALFAEGSLKEAAARYKKAISLQPNYPEAYNNLGLTWERLGEKSRADEAYRQAIAQNPLFPDPAFNLGNIRLSDGLASEAVRYFEQALRLNDAQSRVHNNMGTALEAMGRQRDALDSFRKAISVQPDNHVAHSNLLFCLNNICADPVKIFKEHTIWADVHSFKVQKKVHPNQRDKSRRLRVGYVSPDFKGHSVSRFIEPLFSKHTSAVEVFCYSNLNQPDQVTVRLRKTVDHWRETWCLSDEELVNQVESDHIDILVDLAGHTANNRLRVFSAKPAPVQITYCGYPSTTGLRAMDYRLTDDIADPADGRDRMYSETLVRIPHGFLCYKPDYDSPPVSELPAENRSHITFGSFNTLRKVTEAVIDEWSKILLAVDDSRLVLKNSAFEDQRVCERFQTLFAERGIDVSRLELRKRVQDTFGHLSVYGDIDIALDTFPYNGTTTTCEALWMGVPVLTMKGCLHAGRVGASLLSQLGLYDWIAASEEEYVSSACRLSTEIGELARLRGTLRDRMARSTLCDASLFGRNVENIYRRLWEKWCADAAVR